MSTDLYVSKTRRDRSGHLERGPVHLERGGLTLCGRRLRGFGLTASSTPPAGEHVACKACVKHDEAGTRRAWKA